MIDYQLDLRRKIAITRVTGRLRFAELANHLHRLLRDPDFRVDLDALVVATDLAAVPPPSAVGSLAPLVRAWSTHRRGARWAFVLPTRETRAFAERALREINLQAVTFRCFSAEAVAVDWLLASRLVATAVPHVLSREAQTPARPR